MIMKILGWYSVIFLTLSIFMNIGNDKSTPSVRVGTVLMAIPIVSYIITTLI